MSSSDVTKVDFYSKVREIPDDLLEYWQADKELPEEMDFYEDIKITEASLKIFQNVSFKHLNPTTQSHYSTLSSYVKVTGSSNQQYKIGLHLFPLYRFKSKAPLPEMKIYIKQDSNKKTVLDLPAHVTTRLLEYLNEGRPHLGFTCGQFAAYINGIYSPSNPLVLDKYQFTLAKTEDLSAGDTVVFVNKKCNPLHAAIYLGKGLYLWHSGPVCLRVSTCSDIIKCYSAKKMLKAQLTNKQ